MTSRQTVAESGLPSAAKTAASFVARPAIAKLSPNFHGQSISSR
jgi:hypothetical protein